MQNDNQNNVGGDKAAMDQAALLSFVDDLIRDRKDPHINEQNKELAREELLKQINEDINMHLINLLPEKDQVALDALLDKNPTDDEINNFFMEKIPNLETEMAAVLLNFRQAYLLPVTQAPSAGSGQASSGQAGADQGPSTGSPQASVEPVKTIPSQSEAPKVEEPVSINPVDMSPPPPPPPAPVPEEKMN